MSSMTETTFKVGDKVYWQVGGQELKATIEHLSFPGRYGIAIDNRDSSVVHAIWADEKELRFRRTTIVLKEATHADVTVRSGAFTWTISMVLDPECEIACVMDDEPHELLDAGFDLKLTGRGEMQTEYNIDYHVGGSR